MRSLHIERHWLTYTKSADSMQNWRRKLHASLTKGIARVTLWGTLAMAITAGVDLVFGTTG